MRVCKLCNEEFWSPDASKHRLRYCPTCAEILLKEAEEKREQKKPKLYIKECPICGKTFETTKKDKKLCGSDTCRKKNARILSRAISMKKHEPKVCVCKLCGKEFTSIYGSKIRSYCCEEHKRKAQNYAKHAISKANYKRNRKAQMKSAFIEPVYTKKLYERDNGICGICGRPIELGKSNADVWGLTRDHIVPLSKGGKHCMSNCQIAHRICNSYKMDQENFHIDWDIVEQYPRKDWMKVMMEMQSNN